MEDPGQITHFGLILGAAIVTLVISFVIGLANGKTRRIKSIMFFDLRPKLNYHQCGCCLSFNFNQIAAPLIDKLDLWKTPEMS